MNLDQESMIIRSVWETFWRQKKDGHSHLSCEQAWVSGVVPQPGLAWRVPTACEGPADGGTDPETWGGTSSQAQAGL